MEQGIEHVSSLELCNAAYTRLRNQKLQCQNGRTLGLNKDTACTDNLWRAKSQSGHFKSPKYPTNVRCGHRKSAQGSLEVSKANWLRDDNKEHICWRRLIQGVLAFKQQVPRPESWRADSLGLSSITGPKV